MDRASPRCRTVNIFTLTIAWFLLMKRGRIGLCPQILCRLKGYIHRVPLFVAAVAVESTGYPWSINHRFHRWHRHNTVVVVVVVKTIKSRARPLLHYSVWGWNFWTGSKSPILILSMERRVRGMVRRFVDGDPIIWTMRKKLFSFAKLRI